MNGCCCKQPSPGPSADLRRGGPQGLGHSPHLPLLLPSC